MTAMIRRTVAAAAAAMLMSAVGALTTLDAASAVSLAPHSGSTDVQLDANETYVAVRDGYAKTSSMCSSAITQAYQAGIWFSDWANSSCGMALVICAQDAYAHNRALSGVRFYTNNTYGCLVR